MYYVYLIQSERNGRIYTGYTSDLKRRMREHQSGSSPYTRNNGPYELVYYEAYASEDDAREREKQLKLRSNAYKQLRSRITKSIHKGDEA